MILYLHGFDATSPGNAEKIRQLGFIDEDVRLVSYSTRHPRHDMQHLLKEVEKQCRLSDDPAPLMIGVGLGGYWCERIAFLSGLRAVMINPNLHPAQTMEGKIDRPEEYVDIAAKCVSHFREKNRDNALVILCRQDTDLDNLASEALLSPYYQVLWDEDQGHKLPSLGPHLMAIKAFRAETPHSK
ncbi:UPF0227 protein YcfP [Shewanella sp. NFH-SH190041]|uniref:alpha/beta hydrolase YcfP n=1 Tax=Shewanella sp. NFH-SH190041 TaxID=2950245 RepID=UPI0021C32A2B|nr:alpha/beta hydrolase YcfP [Shewanella sp. NFH-SH190041]BDM63956.1 UPF0227 protein YcfP [Shewanella sp. NFH-SH190041]